MIDQPRIANRAGEAMSAGAAQCQRRIAAAIQKQQRLLAPLDERIQVLGPGEAPLAVIKGRYRFRLLVKSARGVDLSSYLREWLAAGPKTKGNLKLEVDVDPQSFL
jgi:primosomal protein N' (replication factor Y)